MKSRRKYRRLGGDEVNWVSIELPDATVEDKKGAHQVTEQAARAIGRGRRATDWPGIPSSVPRPTQDG